MIFPIHYVHDVGNCPFCGSPATGRILPSSYDGNALDDMTRWLRRGEYVKFLNNSSRNCFCMNCDAEWKGTIKGKWLKSREFRLWKEEKGITPSNNKDIELSARQFAFNEGDEITPEMFKTQQSLYKKKLISNITPLSGFVSTFSTFKDLEDIVIPEDSIRHTNSKSKQPADSGQEFQLPRFYDEPDISQNMLIENCDIPEYQYNYEGNKENISPEQDQPD